MIPCGIPVSDLVAQERGREKKALIPFSPAGEPPLIETTRLARLEFHPR